MPDLKLPDVPKVAKDTLYVAVGLGVITLQRAQVQRRELTKQIDGQIDDARQQLSKVGKTFEDRVKLVEDRLPEQARDVVKSARDAAKDASDQLRNLAGRPASSTRTTAA